MILWIHLCSNNQQTWKNWAEVKIDCFSPNIKILFKLWEPTVYSKTQFPQSLDQASLSLMAAL